MESAPGRSDICPAGNTPPQPDTHKAMHQPHRAEAEAQFNRLYGEYGRDVLAYALARTSKPEDAADVVAETFLVAWRRAADVPSGPTARLWLFGVARRVLANQRRGEGRRTRLAERLQMELPAAVATPPEAGAARSAVMSALERLGEEDRRSCCSPAGRGWARGRSPRCWRLEGRGAYAPAPRPAAAAQGACFEGGRRRRPLHR